MKKYKKYVKINLSEILLWIEIMIFICVLNLDKELFKMDIIILKSYPYLKTVADKYIYHIRQS